VCDGVKGGWDGTIAGDLAGPLYFAVQNDATTVFVDVAFEIGQCLQSGAPCTSNASCTTFGGDVCIKLCTGRRPPTSTDPAAFSVTVDGCHDEEFTISNSSGRFTIDGALSGCCMSGSWAFGTDVFGGASRVGSWSACRCGIGVCPECAGRECP
jgi:hypothetical protein